ncbi:ETSous factor-like 4 [Homarus americanus]|uniref:ETSous factor-like 4 n=1 Tax=Homarus americanus TaxID=6706 RepID=A0A8J5JMV9_HOMAM|nr:ETSous factor-like 4 [Homarus americanus]
MDGSSYEHLRASFTLEEPLFSGDASIDSLCQTYLGNLDSFSSGPDAYSNSLEPPSLSLDYYGSSLDINNLSLDSHSPRLDSLSPRMGSYSPRPDSHNNSGLLEEIEAFSKMDIRDWRGEDCLDWAGSVCRRRGVDQSTLDLWSFKGTCGAHLLQYSCQDFCNNSSSSATTKLHHRATPPKATSPLPYPSPDLSNDISLGSDHWDLTSEDIKDLDRYIQDPNAAPADSYTADGLQGMDFLEQSVPIQYERGPKNWEFVIRLLADPQTNPSLIRWEEQTQGTFRLVQPAVIARMYHYTTGALQPVSEKQLVYRCGPKALKYLIDLRKQGSPTPERHPPSPNILTDIHHHPNSPHRHPSSPEQSSPTSIITRTVLTDIHHHPNSPHRHPSSPDILNDIHHHPNSSHRHPSSPEQFSPTSIITQTVLTDIHHHPSSSHRHPSSPEQSSPTSIITEQSSPTSIITRTVLNDIHHHPNSPQRHPSSPEQSSTTSIITRTVLTDIHHHPNSPHRHPSSPEQSSTNDNEQLI